MQFTHADDERGGIALHEVEEQPHRLPADPPPPFQVQPERRRLRSGAGRRTSRGLAAKLAQRLAQLGRDVADHGQAKIVDIAEMPIEGVRIQARLARQLAQADAPQAAAAAAQAQGRLQQGAFAGSVGNPVLRFVHIAHVPPGCFHAPQVRPLRRADPT
ncbi:hypothetical protein CRPA11_26230 [Pseudomonas aeruginosa]